MFTIPPRTFRLLIATLASASLFVTKPAHAEPRTWNYLTTGNGHGFQVFDANTHRIVAFLEHPYRYLSRSGADDRSDGIGRRDLAFDVYFGLRVGTSPGGWLSEPDSADAPDYLDQTNIIRAPAQLKGIAAESFYFSPFGLEKNAMVALLHAPGASNGFALMNFHLGNGRTEPDANGEATRSALSGAAVIETGPGGGAMVYVAISTFDHADCSGAFNKVKSGADLASSPACTANDISVGFQHTLDAGGWMGMITAYVDNAADADAMATTLQTWVNARTPEKVLDDAKAEWTAWRKPPSADVALCSENEQKLWRMSETVLRMGQVREPNTPTRKNNGMVLASLPPGEWHSGWVRDATYGIVALARMGHHAEAKAAVDFFLNAEPVGKYKSYVSNQDYRVSVVRYFGNGEEEADYSGQPSPNIEIDGWGLVLWAARQYLDASNDVPWLDEATRSQSVYNAMLSGIGIPLENNLETAGAAAGIAKADSSIWESHDDNKRHYLYTTMSAARGFCDLAAISKKKGDTANAEKYSALSKRVNDAMRNAFKDRDGALAGSLEGLSNNKYFDGAAAEAFTWNLLADFEGDTAKATLTMLGKLRVESGGFKRNNDGLSTYDDNEWILVDFRIANAMRRAGKGVEGDSVIATLVSKAASNFYLLPELFNAVARDGQIGKYTGSIPMVGYGGGAYIMTMMDRSGIIEPNDCGDGMGRTLPKVDCGGVIVTPGTGTDSDGGTTLGTGNGAAPSIADLPFAAACLCNTTYEARPSRMITALCFVLPVAFFVRRTGRSGRFGRKGRRIRPARKTSK